MRGILFLIKQFVKERFLLYGIILILCFSFFNGWGQVLSNGSVAVGITSENPFLDASSYFDASVSANNEGKGLVFPQTDLTNWSFKIASLDGAIFPTAFNGMIVFNSGTGMTPITGNNPRISTAVSPGFYYFYNPNQVMDITNGRWVRLSNNLDLISKTVSVSATAPSPAIADMVYFNTAENQFFKCTVSETTTVTPTWIAVSGGTSSSTSLGYGDALPEITAATPKKGDAFFKANDQVLYLAKDLGGGTTTWVATTTLPSGTTTATVSNPVTGSTYYNTTDNKVYVYDGGTWTNTAATNLSIGGTTTTTVTVNSSSGTSAVLPAVSPTSAGVMIADDKKKLDAYPVVTAPDANLVLTGTASGTAVWKGTVTNLMYSATSVTVTVSPTIGTTAIIPGSTSTTAGVMIADDKKKLDGELPYVTAPDIGKILTATATGTATWSAPGPTLYKLAVGGGTTPFSIVAKGYGSPIISNFNSNIDNTGFPGFILMIPDQTILESVQINVNDPNTLLALKNPGSNPGAEGGEYKPPTIYIQIVDVGKRVNTGVNDMFIPQITPVQLNYNLDTHATEFPFQLYPFHNNGFTSVAKLGDGNLLLELMEISAVVAGVGCSTTNTTAEAGPGFSLIFNF